MKTKKFIANLFVGLAILASLFMFVGQASTVTGFLGVLGVIGQVLINLKGENVVKKISSNILVSLPVGVFLYTFLLGFEPGLFTLGIGIVGLLGLAGIVLFNIPEKNEETA